MMPSQRKVVATHAIEIDLAHELGLRLKQSYEFLSKQVGGYDNLGFTKQDHKNYLRTKRQRDMEHGAVANLGRYFSRQLKENPLYYFATQLDCEELITNIFWADARMIIDYSHFDDVITFDTTYSTNRDASPLGVFLGLNHHRKTVVFGGALLYDESIESFVWLFETFLEAMSEKKPITIFTDQDAAMSAAIKVVMPKTYQALCSWHMWQNAEKHLGHLCKNDSQFNVDFLACIYEYDGEDEFLTAWNEMLDKYDVHENKWLIDLFKLKEKRAQAYVKRTFTAGMKTTQLSESFNANLKDCLHTDLNIVEFFTHFEIVVNQKRDKELEAGYNSRQKFPRLKLKSSPMLNQVAIVYTPKLFDLFQIEVEEEIYAHDVMAQNKTEDISSGNITSFTQLLMSASTSSASHQGGSSASVALASHLESISSVVGSNDKINGAGGLLTQGSVASGGPLTQESFTSGWNEMVHKVKPFF
ncbi:protein FAR1-RELATED SEQUENCE 5-like [Quercus robur]|uniref:protein FAR1-RELATED SEQUENCE 5-like n=1 Tax=Quercus robur TaxID=38942 RepID=UPI002163EF23|nr:protein FAR1-RELATED SEQUENCE 5-like [Quercus robur]